MQVPLVTHVFACYSYDILIFIDMLSCGYVNKYNQQSDILNLNTNGWR